MAANGTKIVVMSVRVSEPDYRKLKRLGKSSDRPVSWLVRAAISELLERQG